MQAVSRYVTMITSPSPHLDLQGGVIILHLADEETEAQGGRGACPGSHSQEPGEQDTSPRSVMVEHHPGASWPAVGGREPLCQTPSTCQALGWACCIFWGLLLCPAVLGGCYYPHFPDGKAEA